MLGFLVLETKTGCQEAISCWRLMLMLMLMLVDWCGAERCRAVQRVWRNGWLDEWYEGVVMGLYVCMYVCMDLSI